MALKPMMTSRQGFSWEGRSTNPESTNSARTWVKEKVKKHFGSPSDANTRFYIDADDYHYWSRPRYD